MVPQSVHSPLLVAVDKLVPHNYPIIRAAGRVNMGGVGLAVIPCALVFYSMCSCVVGFILACCFVRGGLCLQRVFCGTYRVVTRACPNTATHVSALLPLEPECGPC